MSLRVSVDWDGTLVEEAWPDMGRWLPDAVDCLRELEELGFEPVIFSCRVAPFEMDEETPRDPSIEVGRITKKLTRRGLGHLEVWTRPYKPGAAYYLDNRNPGWRGIRHAVDLIREEVAA